MKGIVVEDNIYLSTLDYVHGFSQSVKRIIIPEMNNLAITPHDDQIYVYTGYEIKDETKKVKEIEVPDELVQKTLEYERAQYDFFRLKGKFQELL
jgi:hypothetical protein